MWYAIEDYLKANIEHVGSKADEYRSMDFEGGAKLFPANERKHRECQGNDHSGYRDIGNGNALRHLGHLAGANQQQGTPMREEYERTQCRVYAEHRKGTDAVQPIHQ